MPLGLDTVRQLRQKTELQFDCHVMVTAQDYFVDELLDIGVEQIVFHAEPQPHIDGMLNRIHAKGVRAGVALKPSTPLTELEYVLEKCDTVLLMLINPGYAFVKGEKQVAYAQRKIKDLRQMIESRGLHTKIEVDGRISPANIEQYGAGGSLFPLGIAKKARAAVDCRIVHIGSNPNSEMRDIADFMVRIPVRTKNYLLDEIDSCQPITSLFEQSVLLIGDILAKLIIKQKQLDMRALWQYHANLE